MCKSCFSAFSKRRINCSDIMSLWEIERESKNKETFKFWNLKTWKEKKFHKSFFYKSYRDLNSKWCSMSKAETRHAQEQEKRTSSLSFSPPILSNASLRAYICATRVFVKYILHFAGSFGCLVSFLWPMPWHKSSFVDFSFLLSKCDFKNVYRIRRRFVFNS